MEYDMTDYYIRQTALDYAVKVYGTSDEPLLLQKATEYWAWLRAGVKEVEKAADDI